MGWLHWTENKTLNADVNSIQLAMEGKMEMMNPNPRPQKASHQTFAAKFKAFANDHNVRQKLKEQKAHGSRPKRS